MIEVEQKMDTVEFRCVSCGRREETEVLAIGHAIRGYGRKLTEEADCCDNSHYIDTKGFRKAPRSTSLMDRIGSIKA